MRQYCRILLCVVMVKNITKLVWSWLQPVTFLRTSLYFVLAIGLKLWNSRPAKSLVRYDNCMFTLSKSQYDICELSACLFKEMICSMKNMPTENRPLQYKMFNLFQNFISSDVPLPSQKLTTSNLLHFDIFAISVFGREVWIIKPSLITYLLWHQLDANSLCGSSIRTDSSLICMICTTALRRSYQSNFRHTCYSDADNFTFVFLCNLVRRL